MLPRHAGSTARPASKYFMQGYCVFEPQPFVSYRFYFGGADVFPDRGSEKYLDGVLRAGWGDPSTLPRPMFRQPFRYPVRAKSPLHATIEAITRKSDCSPERYLVVPLIR